MATFSNRQMSVPVPVEFINKYMINANATYVKVYLYGLAKCCEPEADVTNASIAEALDILETDVTKAWRYWKKVGLVSAVGKDRLIFEPVIADAADLPKKKAADEAAASAPAEEKPQHKRATMSDVSANQGHDCSGGADSEKNAFAARNNCHLQLYGLVRNER